MFMLNILITVMIYIMSQKAYSSAGESNTAENLRDDDQDRNQEYLKFTPRASTSTRSPP